MITIKDLHKAFDTFKVLDGVNLTLKDNEILSIIGKSGAGKSVLIKNILGLIIPDNGSIIVDDMDTKNFSEIEFNKYIRKKVGIVFQEGALWDSLTVCENICLALQIQKQLDEGERKKQSLDCLKMVDLANIKDVYPDELSGGMLKRAAIARAIVMEPKYLLYDEPTTGLDPILSNVINNLIKRMNVELGITSMIISHDIRGVEDISDRVSMLYKGKIHLTCDVNDLWKQDDEIFNNFIKGNVITNEY